MEMNMEYVHVTQSDRLEALLQEKLDKLHRKYDWVIRADVFLKNMNKTGEDEMSCGIRLSAPGPRLYAETSSPTFESAIGETIRDLERQLEKRKDKMISH